MSGQGAERLKVLLVDDELGYLEVLQKRMSKRNLEVTPVSSGTEAVRQAREQRFDVAVVDLKMEDMDGIEVLKVLKMMDPKMAVIILTGHGSEQAAREGMALGAFDYLTKPCELSDLLTRIYASQER
ncbi:MAG: response regulator [Proteobacteria bacterium]|nr:response regulator [Pseudomonadota bacterium]MBU4277570.1 response regulator [Pseudomonadota bacterium]MBU4384542.1 response regulator [Pseudomonadota bacterium]MCG2766310.1 response regulator [Desulfarculaceae bacterium]